MYRINLKETCGKQTVTRKDGQAVADMISKNWNKEEKITIDFSNIQIASVSFFDQAFGMLAFNYNKDELKQKLNFENLDDYDRALLNDILISRFHQKELGLNGHSNHKRKQKQ